MSSKLVALIKTITLFYQIPEADNLGTAKQLKKEITSNIELLVKFKEFANIKQIADLIEEFYDDVKGSLDDASMERGFIDQLNIRLVIKLSLLRNNIDYFFKDSQTYIRKTVEVAFQHLQRSLIADQSLRDVWGANLNEVHFEKLGSTHLLLHRIWAFKVNAAGERTDLVLSEKINKDNPLYECVDGLVLTEWKYVRNPSQISFCIESAKAQTKLYKNSSLGSIELSKYYYLVMVSEDMIPCSETIVEKESGIIYRIINIAYSPSTPSVASRRAKKESS